MRHTTVPKASTFRRCKRHQGKGAIRYCWALSLEANVRRIRAYCRRLRRDPWFRKMRPRLRLRQRFSSRAKLQAKA